MAKDTGVFLPDEQEPQIPKKSPQSARVGDHANRAVTAKAAHADPAKLSEQELKSAIIAAWKKHEELAKKDLAPMLYWLRQKLRAQGARNDLTQDKDRGFGFWVEEHLDFSRRTADRWCDWYAVEAGIKPEPTFSHVTKSDLDMAVEDLDTHSGKLQIAFNVWVPKAMHAQYQKALAHLQKQFGVKDKKEALVRGVIYAATVINKGTVGRRNARLVGQLSVPHGRPERKARGRRQVPGSIRAVNGERKVQGSEQLVTRAKRAVGHQQSVHGTHGHRAEGSSKAAQAAAGR